MVRSASSRRAVSVPHPTLSSAGFAGSSCAANLAERQKSWQVGSLISKEPQICLWVNADDIPLCCLSGQGLHRADKQDLALFYSFVISLVFKFCAKRAAGYRGHSFLLSGYGCLSKPQNMLPQGALGPSLAMEMMLNSSKARVTFFPMKDCEAPLRSQRPLDPL